MTFLLHEPVCVCPLAIVATLYAFLVRNVDSNFSESKWISYAMYSVCVSWMIDGVILVFTVSERASSLRSNVDPDPEVSIQSAWTECPRSWNALQNINDISYYEVNKNIIHFQQNHALACIANSSQALLVMMFLFAHRVYKVYQVEQSNVRHPNKGYVMLCTFPGIKHEEQPRRG